jgi:hypothetical protein
MAQHQDFSKYEEWSKAIVDGARAWFETKTTDESGPPWFGDDGREKEPYFGLALAVIRGKCGYRAAEFTTTLLPNECAASSGCIWCARPVIFQQNPPFCDIGPCAVFL